MLATIVLWVKGGGKPSIKLAWCRWQGSNRPPRALVSGIRLPRGCSHSLRRCPVAIPTAVAATVTLPHTRANQPASSMAMWKHDSRQESAYWPWYCHGSTLGLWTRVWYSSMDHPSLVAARLRRDIVVLGRTGLAGTLEATHGNTTVKRRSRASHDRYSWEMSNRRLAMTSQPIVVISCLASGSLPFSHEVDAVWERLGGTAGWLMRAHTLLTGICPLYNQATQYDHSMPAATGSAADSRSWW